MKTAAITSSNELVGTACNVYGLYIRTTGTEGTVVLKDGGATEATIVTFNTPAAEGHIYITVPGDGIEFATTCHGVLTNVDGLTIFYK